MFKHLLVPIDGSDLSQRAIAASLALAAQLQASVTGFVVEPEASAGGLPTPLSGRDFEAAEAAAAAHAKRLLEHFRSAARDAEVPFHSHFVRTAHIDQAIVAAADSQRCDLIVMVTHGRGAFSEMLFGSHTKSVLSLSKVPLLVLH